MKLFLKQYFSFGMPFSNPKFFLGVIWLTEYKDIFLFVCNKIITKIPSNAMARAASAAAGRIFLRGEDTNLPSAIFFWLAAARAAASAQKVHDLSI